MFPLNTIYRKTADSTLRCVEERARTVNTDDSFVMGVTDLFVYGEYAGGREPYGSLDVGVRLSCKWEGETARYLMELKRDEHRYKDGKDRQNWPALEVLKYLRSRRTVTIRLFGDEPTPRDAIPLALVPVTIQNEQPPTVRRCDCGCRARLNKVSEDGFTTYSVGCWGCKRFTKPRATLVEAVRDWNGGDCYYLRSRTPHTHRG